MPLSGNEPGPKEGEPQASSRGGELILLADDDEKVLNSTKATLENAGYSVIAAAGGGDALRKFQENMENIYLVVLDIVMPEKSEAEVYKEIKGIKQNARVLFTVGYTRNFLMEK